jgi:hypothetical protein
LGAGGRGSKSPLPDQCDQGECLGTHRPFGPMYHRCIGRHAPERVVAMGWEVTGQPTVRKQRDKWVVRVDGIDAETGKHRPKQIGTYASQRAALAAARSANATERIASRDTVSWLVRRYVTSRTDVTLKAR